MKVYCIFCKSGSEDIVAEKIAALCPELEALIPVRTLKQKRNGVWVSTRQQLIPGYIFLYVKNKIVLQNIKKLLNVYKILDYGIGSRELKNNDYEYAMWIYRHCGNIGESRIVLEGSTVRVIDGPLLDCVGKIIRIDRHKQRAWVEFEFNDNKQVISLSIEDVTSYVA